MRYLFGDKPLIRRGTTMMEVLTAAIIISIVASYVLPAADSFYSSEQVTAAASMLTADVRYARAYAIDRQTYVRLHFMPDGWEVQEAFDDFDNPLPAGNDFNTAHYLESILDESERFVPAKVNLEFMPVATPDVYFSPDGFLRSKPGFNSPPSMHITVNFVYVNAVATVEISASGALESKAWYREDFGDDW